jgi:hypothetical protein
VLILGGTELALLLPSAIVAELPAFNTMALHVDAIVKRLRASNSDSWQPIPKSDRFYLTAIRWRSYDSGLPQTPISISL